MTTAPVDPADPAPQQHSGTSGWLIALGVVVLLALGGLAAAIISKGDSGSSTATAPSVVTKTTTVQENNTTKVTTTNVTTSAPAVTIQPNVTLSPSGTVGTATSGAPTDTTTSP
jgi:flagellar basal body-associated protein FliL